ncbi:Hydantoinase B/oxoprolinase-domain-containing protein [Kockovaella imperatae]|uniref:Hydantoinase B/oxoprolinase-domain-containing protein n=1 Tax=Kockovaella imperatae TaxID=4999 RepID=A0A1Y1U9T6_9TREE|nr:Hydantoinase B/oxoprolinase-domain-containing protein [Kockovaella imperatae]ORX34267.1 Hydantoinase B/oxoprolinase-domain-containing protein [Kockovaella imperatae]
MSIAAPDRQSAGSSLARIAIDRGGTFTDAICSRPGEEDIVIKLLSVDPQNYKDAPTEAIRRILSLLDPESKPIPKDQPLSLDRVESIRMGTTVSTNALLERKGEKCALITSKGWGDVLLIGMQARPDIFDLSVRKLSFLYDEVVEIDERITPYQSLVSPKISLPEHDDSVITQTTTGEPIRILRRPDRETVSRQLDELKAKGINSIAVAFVHSYLWSDHEDMVASLAKEKGFAVSVSSELQPMIKLVARANSSIADSYLTPVTRRYIESFGAGFEGGIEAFGSKLLFMQSDGGLCKWNNFSGLRAILSGPAGGVVGYSKTCYDPQRGSPLIAVDMGGTSTDVSRYAGKLEHVFETTTAEVIIQAPQLDINTVAAGGGSRLFYRHGMFVVGPESATAHPGPACYRKGGPLAVTDANLILGRLLPEHFPKIFGPNENEGLDIQASKTLFEEMTTEINEGKAEQLSIEQVAAGFLRIANEAMCRPIRTLTEARGFECSSHHLVMFGGAGGQHACSIANTLGIKRIIVPRLSSLLSAYGMALADVVREATEPAAFTVTNNRDNKEISRRMKLLVQKAEKDLEGQGFPKDRIRSETYLNCRYSGTSTQLMIESPKDGNYESRFFEEHKREFGFNLEKRDILVDDLRVRAVGKSIGAETRSPYEDFENCEKKEFGGEVEQKQVYFDSSGWVDTAVVPLSKLSPGDQVRGPAVIFDKTQTILVEPSHLATSLPEHVVIDLVEEKAAQHKTDTSDYDYVDPVQLSVYGHRLMGIAEQMGDILRKISISLNIKERLDYSCAIFAADGGLVANAPHIPVHLGAMSHAVRYQAQILGHELEEGDVLLSNHPAAGGSHLPDLTVIMPAFHDGRIIFWTAARAHHADIGGIRPGSMPPFSKELWEEGAQVKSFKLVKRGQFDEKGVIKILSEDPAQYPGCSGTRTLSDNLSDLHAQVAACHRGVVLINTLVNEQSFKVVDFYMHAIMLTAERAVRDLLRHIHKKFGGESLQAVDWLDDGTQLALKLDIDPASGDAVFDFTGTSPQIHGNFNTPTAVVYSAIIYVLRSLIVSDLPLNQGCLAPIKLVVPPDSLLAPTDEVAVCAGNTEASQRVTDVIFKAFQACAASQGGCNNLTFGIGPREVGGKTVPGFGYYETIAGGSGAGPDWDGQHCVHCHMTNTAIGDVEMTERVYPVVIHRFSRRPNTGGNGRHKGGDGCIRDIEFTEDLDVAILSQRRVIPPYGMAGGEPGTIGINTWLKGTKDGKHTIINLGGSNQTKMKKGDHIIINTPGGGGYGVPGTIDERLDDEVYKRSIVAPVRASGSLAAFKAAQMSAV